MLSDACLKKEKKIVQKQLKGKSFPQDHEILIKMKKQRG